MAVDIFSIVELVYLIFDYIVVDSDCCMFRTSTLDLTHLLTLHLFMNDIGIHMMVIYVGCNLVSFSCDFDSFILLFI